TIEPESDRVYGVTSTVGGVAVSPSRQGRPLPCLAWSRRQAERRRLPATGVRRCVHHIVGATERKGKNQVGDIPPPDRVAAAIERLRKETRERVVGELIVIERSHMAGHSYGATSEPHPLPEPLRPLTDHRGGQRCPSQLSNGIPGGG